MNPYVAVGLTGPQLLALAQDPDLLARWDTAPLAFTVLGTDRLDGRPPSSTTLDASAVAASLVARTTGARFLVAATPQRDHPYNLARRVAALGHLSRGRTGVLLGTVDGYAPLAEGPDGAWGGAGLGGGAPLTAATALDAARAVRALEQSWPWDSVVGDRGTGILVHSDRIVHVDLDGVWRIAGPLNAPEPPTGPSVVGWWGAAEAEESPGAPSYVDLTVGASASVRLLPGDEAWPAPQDVAASGAAGVLVPGAADQSPADLLDAAHRLLDAGYAALTGGPSLRSALGLAEPPALTANRAAYPAPQPHPSL